MSASRGGYFNPMLVTIGRLCRYYGKTLARSSSGWECDAKNGKGPLDEQAPYQF